MAVLENIEPKRVFAYFEHLCAIPHGSGNTKAVSDWLVSFAQAHLLWYTQDEANNVVIKKPATPGYENAEPVILQGHIDMVCEKTDECEKDMKRDGLDLAVAGDTIFAKGTTLGGDDGIAVAMMLAVLDDDSLEHPSIEAVFTTDEEIGLLGAAALDADILSGKRLINLDSEDEGIFTVSCAGGACANCHIPVTREEFEGTALCLTVDGLRGGHSGAGVASVVSGSRLRARISSSCGQESPPSIGSSRASSANGVSAPAMKPRKGGTPLPGPLPSMHNTASARLICGLTVNAMSISRSAKRG